MSDDSRWQELEERIAAIVAEGRAVRDRVADAVASAIAGSKASVSGVEEILECTAKGGFEGAKRASAESSRGVLREVVDGVGDGVARAALAVKLAFDEARKRGQAFARQDLEQLGREVGSAGQALVDAFVRAAVDAGDELAGQAEAIREHAEATRQQIEPGLRAAAEAVRQDPLGLAMDAAQAGTKAARQATGELFDALSGMLGEAAQRLKRR